MLTVMTDPDHVDLQIDVDDPRADDVRPLLERHLAFSHHETPIEASFALAVDGLVDPGITFVSARRDGQLLAVGALKRLDATHAELKSMHTTVAARRQGVGQAVVEHLLAHARTTGVERVSLETGTTPAFAAARSLYASSGFVPCGPFADYAASPWNTFMTLSRASP